jgi:hypothetical protein
MFRKAAPSSPADVALALDAKPPLKKIRANKTVRKVFDGSGRFTGGSIEQMAEIVVTAM